MRKAVIFLSVAVLLVIMGTSVCLATPSGKWSKKGGQIFDEWNICRTKTQGKRGFFQVTRQGFRPVIAFESLGEHSNMAYKLGKRFARDYPDRHQRAERIFKFVRDRVEYIADTDQFDHPEFAQNADELAEAIKEKGSASGDCEDMALLLAVMYKGAGYRSGIALAPGHAATVIHLPDYRKANTSLTLAGENGWIWAEATGKNNRLGWMPEKLMGEKLMAYEVSGEEITVPEPEARAEPVTPESGVNTSLMASPFGIVIFLMFILSIFRGRRK